MTLVWFLIAGIVFTVVSVICFGAARIHNFRTSKGDTFACGFVIFGLLGISLTLGPISRDHNPSHALLTAVYLAVYFGLLYLVSRRSQSYKERERK